MLNSTDMESHAHSLAGIPDVGALSDEELFQELERERRALASGEEAMRIDMERVEAAKQAIRQLEAEINRRVNQERKH